MRRFANFAEALQKMGEDLRSYGYQINPEKWQGVQAPAPMIELLNYSLQVQLPTVDLAHYQADIQPNLPWADEHFEERVSGIPHNPPPSWVRWPWALSAEKFKEVGKFDHTYPERFWPPVDMKGIRFPVGNYDDMIAQLQSDPSTRQAYLPIWFPEDTGGVEGGRVPCTLGYHLIRRHGFLHIVYYIRSCDMTRHLRDDIYFTIRLLLDVLEKLRQRETPENNAKWGNVQPGTMTMHITSLHAFITDPVVKGRNRS